MTFTGEFNNLRAELIAHAEKVLSNCKAEKHTTHLADVITVVKVFNTATFLTRIPRHGEHLMQSVSSDPTEAMKFTAAVAQFIAQQIQASINSPVKVLTCSYSRALQLAIDTQEQQLVALKNSKLPC